MKIGELAKQTGLAASAIRFYESKGLLKVGSRQSNGYRDYPEEAVTVLRIITDAQHAGFSLEEIAQLLPDEASTWKHDELLGALRKKIADIEALELRLARSKSELQSLVEMIESKPADLGCKESAELVMATIEGRRRGQSAV